VWWNVRGIVGICHWNIFRIFQISRQCIYHVDFRVSFWSSWLPGFAVGWGVLEYIQISRAYIIIRIGYI
jgi:hypothetical protein